MNHKQPSPTRRGLLTASAVLLAAPAIVRAQGMMGDGMMGRDRMNGRRSPGRPDTLIEGEPFRPLPVLDTANGLSLRAMAGTTRFGTGAPTPTMGFERPYLGPTLRMRRGSTVAATVANATDVPISTHWHGLNVPSPADGGSHHSMIAPDATWNATLPVRQPAATLWYHTHVHGRTAPDQWAGLAGALIVDDDDADALGLPSDPGVDDLVLILQDKRFGSNGRAIYEPNMMDIMHGYVGDVVLANGQLAPRAAVPAGPVRLRLINAATSARHVIAFPRPTVLIGVDQGLLPKPVEVGEVSIAPGERVEVVVDMGDGGEAAVTVAASSLDGGMMRGGMMDRSGSGDSHPLIQLVADSDRPARGRVPERLTDDLPPLPQPTSTRRFALGMGMGMGGMRGMGGMKMTINGKPFEPDRIDFTAGRGTLERWRVESRMMAHPFHAHGVKFRIPDPQRPEETGWKDVAVVRGTRDLLVSIDAATERDIPFMFHCHILEHEDAGMMGQFLTG